MNAQVVRHIVLAPVAQPAQSKSQGAPRRRLGTLKDMESGEAHERPQVRLPSGAVRAVESVRTIPHMGMVEIRTVADLSDGGRSRTLRVPLNTPIVGFARMAPPKVEESKTE